MLTAVLFIFMDYSRKNLKIMKLCEEDIIEFCKMFNYDIRKSHYGRWIDQKCTPDVVWSVSDFILNYVDNIKPHFSPKDIWNSEYAKETVAETFSALP